MNLAQKISGPVIVQFGRWSALREKTNILDDSMLGSGPLCMGHGDYPACDVGSIMLALTVIPKQHFGPQYDQIPDSR